MKNILHCQFHFLATDGVRNIGHLDAFGRDVPWCTVLADGGFDSVNELVGKLSIFTEFNEKNNSHIIVPVLSNHQTVHDLGNAFHLTVYFSGANAYTSRIKGGIRAAIDDDAAVLGYLDIIPMQPDSWIHIEVSLSILGIVGIVPEINGHTWRGKSADKLTFVSCDRITLFIVSLHLHAKAAALEFRSINRSHRIAESKARDDIRAP